MCVCVWVAGSRLSQVSLVEVNMTFCNHTAGPTHLSGDSASSAEFFVGVGVVCFLYCMVALLVYLGYMHVYKDSDFGPIIVSRCKYLYEERVGFLPPANKSAK